MPDGSSSSAIRWFSALASCHSFRCAARLEEIGTVGGLVLEPAGVPWVYSGRDDTHVVKASRTADARDTLHLKRAGTRDAKALELSQTIPRSGIEVFPNEGCGFARFPVSTKNCVGD